MLYAMQFNRVFDPAQCDENRIYPSPSSFPKDSLNGANTLASNV